MQYYAVLDFHLPLKAGSVYGFMYACCIYSRNIEGCYSEFSYIEKVDLGCEKGKHVEIPFLFWIQLYKAPPPQYFYTDRSKAVLLLWFLTVTCSCCPYLYFGLAIMLVTYFVNFR